MKVLFATGRLYLPEFLGGAEHSTHTLLEKLEERGSRCEAVVALGPGPRHLLYRLLRLLTRRRLVAIRDGRLGYSTYRAWDTLVVSAVRERIAAFRPDLVLTQLDASPEIGKTAVACGIPVIHVSRDAQFLGLPGELPRSPLVLLVANSRFVAARLRERYGVDPPVIPPLVRYEDYRVAARSPEHVTFVNPHPVKGFAVAAEVAARLPHRRFLFVESWTLDRKLKAEVVARLAGLANVALRPRSRNMRAVYGRTSLLLMPSQWEESFGRVALEAQASGIPVVASDTGGTPEALLGGAIVLPAKADPGVYAEAVERILGDPRLEAEMSAAALANVARPEVDPDRIADLFLEVATGHVERCKAVAAGGRTP